MHRTPSATLDYSVVEWASFMAYLNSFRISFQAPYISEVAPFAAEVRSLISGIDRSNVSSPNRSNHHSTLKSKTYCWYSSIPYFSPVERETPRRWKMSCWGAYFWFPCVFNCLSRSNPLDNASPSIFVILPLNFSTWSPDLFWLNQTGSTLTQIWLVNSARICLLDSRVNMCNKFFSFNTCLRLLF